MVREASLRAAAGVTAQVETVAEGTRVTLRACGAGRWAGVAFLAVWLAGWVCGELFALAMLGAMAGKAMGLLHAQSLPTGTAAVGIGAFLTVWLSFWTVGGVAAIRALLRSAWGRDVLTIGRDHWTLWQGVGPWGRSQRLAPGQVSRVALRRGGGTLVAETGAGSVTLTTLGAGADRLWLRDTLREAAGLDPATGMKTAHGSRLTAHGAGKDGLYVEPRAVSREPPFLSAGYKVEQLRDGTTRVAMTAQRRLGQAGCMLFLSLFWNGIVGVFVLAGLGVLPMSGEGNLNGAMAPGASGYWMFLTPFILVGVGFMAGFGWAAVGREEWWAAPGQLTIHRSLLGYHWSRRYSAASLALLLQVDSDGDESWKLVIETDGRQRPLDSGDPGRLRALGLLLAERTGWSLYQPEGR